ncbi:MAG: hypothetical protein ACYDGN_17550 [Acidimicrobiales bacterium]
MAVNADLYEAGQQWRAAQDSLRGQYKRVRRVAAAAEQFGIARGTAGLLTGLSWQSLHRYLPVRSPKVVTPQGIHLRPRARFRPDDVEPDDIDLAHWELFPRDLSPKVAAAARRHLGALLEAGIALARCRADAKAAGQHLRHAIERAREADLSARGIAKAAGIARDTLTDLEKRGA